MRNWRGKGEKEKSFGGKVEIEVCGSRTATKASSSKWRVGQQQL